MYFKRETTTQCLGCGIVVSGNTRICPNCGEILFEVKIK